MKKYRFPLINARVLPLLFVSVFAGCDGISIAPSCPNTLQVGQSAPVVANETNPGAVPKYTWTVEPANAGTFEDPTAAQTNFTAQTPVTATVTLTASDGLYQVISQCHIEIGAGTGGGALTVRLTSSPARPTTGSSVILTCTASSGGPATSFVIDQTAGTALTITPGAAGVATVTPTAAGDYTFRCVGSSASGEQSTPATVTISVTTGGRPGGGRPGTRG